MKNSIESFRESDFATVVKLIRDARARACQNVNKELVMLYWNVGSFISRKLETSEWGEDVVGRLASHIRTTIPEMRGFTKRGLYRMKQFYETYKYHEKVSTLLTQLPWSAHLMLMSRTRSEEEREFYLGLTVKNRYTVRELGRQIDSALYERTVLSNQRLPKLLPKRHRELATVFRDSYVFEFLNLSAPFPEKELKLGLVAKLRQFLLELGPEFCFVGEDFRVQVGLKDFFLDLLLYHRGLSCLVAVELKTTQFQPEYLGKLNFYLEALDRDVRTERENPSVGILLCGKGDTTVVEYAMARSLSPTLVAQYRTTLPAQELLQKKMEEFSELAQSSKLTH